ncbi:MAG TPA: DUF308 domain-containing protein [Prolixibacteraceae bacterium]|nr:DUF308 domain-containing protein [Prolixibacteraceae bacterium]
MFYSIQNINPNRLLLRGSLAIAIGLVILLVPDMSMVLVMRILGALLLADGVIALLINYFKKKKEPQTFYNIVPKGTLSFIMAIILLAFPTLLVNVFVFVVGLILFMAGLTQLLGILNGSRTLGFSLTTLIISIIALLAGIVLLLKPFESAQTILMFFGAIIAVYGVGEVIRSFRVRKFQKANPKPGPDIIDTDYEEVK